jgi:TnpA family transposase
MSFAAIFGSGAASSSDGQFFQASGFGRAASRLNAHYGQQSGFKVYTHLSDRYGPFFTKLIAATASEALHVLDALLYHQSEVSIRRHHTDGGGDSDHVFALCVLLGFQFAPRIPGLKHRRLYSFGRPSDYPTLEPLIAGRINLALIRAHWSEILRIIASLRAGTVTASLIMRQLASYPRQNGVAAALRELGRLERTLFTLDWIEDPELRRTTGQELNKGEARNSLARAVFIHRLGEIRDRTYENQQHRASGLNLLVTAIILWNTRYLERAVATLRQTEDVPDHLLAHLSLLDRRLGGLRHLPQPGQPVLAGLFLTLCQRIEPASLLGGETIGQPAIHFRTGLVAEFGAEPLECGRRWNDDPVLPACLHHQFGQTGEPIILNGLRQKGACQLGCGTFAERTKPELLLAFDGMTLAVPLRREIPVDRVRKNPDLRSDECE